MDFVLTQKEFRERLKETSPKIVDLMSSEEAEDVLEAVSREYQIEPARTRLLAFYVAHVFLGVLPPKEFRGAIEKDLGFGSENALHIAEEIDHKLFQKVKKELHDAYGIKTFTKEPAPHRPIPAAPLNPLSSPPLDLRMRRPAPAAPFSPGEEFPGEIINGRPENREEQPPRITPELQKEPLPPKPEPPPRPAPPKHDSYLEPINEEGPRPIQEGSVINLKNQ